jgi:hypothetical protein
MCLYCNEKSKLYLTLAAVQKHMLDKAHCKIRHEQDALIEYSRLVLYTVASVPSISKHKLILFQVLRLFHVVS